MPLWNQIVHTMKPTCATSKVNCEIKLWNVHIMKVNCTIAKEHYETKLWNVHIVKKNLTTLKVLYETKLKNIKKHCEVKFGRGAPMKFDYATSECNPLWSIFSWKEETAT